MTSVMATESEVVSGCVEEIDVSVEMEGRVSGCAVSGNV
jgi:hypothetical protein